jgi:hypothetical protein
MANKYVLDERNLQLMQTNRLAGFINAAGNAAAGARERFGLPVTQIAEQPGYKTPLPLPAEKSDGSALCSLIKG